MKVKIHFQGLNITTIGIFIALIGTLMLVGAWAYYLAGEIFSEDTPAIVQLAVPIAVVGLILVIVGLIRQSFSKTRQNPDLEKVEN